MGFGKSLKKLLKRPEKVGSSGGSGAPHGASERRSPAPPAAPPAAPRVAPQPAPHAEQRAAQGVPPPPPSLMDALLSADAGQAAVAAGELARQLETSSGDEAAALAGCLCERPSALPRLLQLLHPAGSAALQPVDAEAQAAAAHALALLAGRSACADARLVECGAQRSALAAAARTADAAIAAAAGGGEGLAQPGQGVLLLTLVHFLDRLLQGRQPAAVSEFLDAGGAATVARAMAALGPHAPGEASRRCLSVLLQAWALLPSAFDSLPNGPSPTASAESAASQLAEQFLAAGGVAAVLPLLSCGHPDLAAPAAELVRLLCRLPAAALAVADGGGVAALAALARDDARMSGTEAGAAARRALQRLHETARAQPGCRPVRAALREAGVTSSRAGRPASRGGAGAGAAAEAPPAASLMRTCSSGLPLSADEPQLEQQFSNLLQSGSSAYRSSADLEHRPVAPQHQQQQQQCEAGQVRGGGTQAGPPLSPFSVLLPAGASSTPHTSAPASAGSSSCAAASAISAAPSQQLHTAQHAGASSGQGMPESSSHEGTRRQLWAGCWASDGPGGACASRTVTVEDAHAAGAGTLTDSRGPAAWARQEGSSSTGGAPLPAGCFPTPVPRTASRQTRPLLGGLPPCSQARTAASPPQTLRREPSSGSASASEQEGGAGGRAGEQGGGREPSGELPAKVAADLAAVAEGFSGGWMIDGGDISICQDEKGEDIRLGEGGFGVVYQGLMHGCDEVAVKCIKAAAPSPADYATFTREVALLASLRHRNIVQFYGASLQPGSLFLVTELMAGGDLYSALRRHPAALAWERLGRRVALDVALGLHHLHSRRPPLFHRDLKSPNVLLSEEGVAKIADVGMARPQLGGLLTAQPLMTPLFAAPEVLRRERAGPMADIWSLGIIVWELATQADITAFQPLALTAPLARPPHGAAVLEMPVGAPPIAAHISQACTQLDPGARPSAQQVVEWLRACM